MQLNTSALYICVYLIWFVGQFVDYVSDMKLYHYVMLYHYLMNALMTLCRKTCCAQT